MKSLILEQHSENIEWMQQLDFYKDELDVFKNRLAEIAQKYTDKEVLAEVEHFQNNFIVQRNTIDELLHSIKANEQKLQNEINENNVAVDHRKTEYHAEEKERVEGFTHVFLGLREEFNQFLARWM